MKYIIDPERYADLLEDENEQLKSYIAELEEENARLVNTPVVDETKALAKRVFELEEEVTKYKDIRGEKMTDQLLVSRLDPFELLHEIEQLQHHITVLEEERRWIPVSERLPEKDGYYLCYDDKYDQYFDALFRHGAWAPVIYNDVITHWMPLPEPPEVEIERFTVHSDIERQDDKSPNDTQTDTVVYGKWIPVGERLPEDCERVLVRATNSPQNLPRRAFHTYRNGKWVNDEVDIDNVYSNLNVTHWMPLPPNPES